MKPLRQFFLHRTILLFNIIQNEILRIFFLFWCLALLGVKGVIYTESTLQDCCLGFLTKILKPS